MSDKIDICSLTVFELEKFICNMGEKKFRARQIFEWINKKNVREFENMTNLSLILRQMLEKHFYFNRIDVLKRFECDDSSIKFLSKLDDSNIIESVIMKYSYGNTVCVSSQVGCKMKCKFCMSTFNGLVRNLNAGEMCWQVYLANKIAPVSNIVIMGSGEPLDNYDNVIKFIKMINSKDGINIGQRHITLSTCGIVDKIYELAQENLQITLAISLHAPNDFLRQKIMSVANKYKINDIIRACEFYFEKTKRRITFEYVLIDNVNDNQEDAYELLRLLKNFPCHINLIPINEIENADFKPSPISKQNKFMQILTSCDKEVTIRRKLGKNINAACGQLRNSYIKKMGDSN